MLFLTVILTAAPLGSVAPGFILRCMPSAKKFHFRFPASKWNVNIPVRLLKTSPNEMLTGPPTGPTLASPSMPANQIYRGASLKRHASASSSFESALVCPAAPVAMVRARPVPSRARCMLDTIESNPLKIPPLRVSCAIREHIGSFASRVSKGHDLQRLQAAFQLVMEFDDLEALSEITRGWDLRSAPADSAVVSFSTSSPDST